MDGISIEKVHRLDDDTEEEEQEKDKGDKAFLDTCETDTSVLQLAIHVFPRYPRIICVYIYIDIG